MTPLEEAEEEAALLLFTSWDEGRLPIDPMELAEGLGIAVRYREMPPDQSGKIVMLPGKAPVITINHRDHPHRQRFTCAHEIGHYVRRKKGGHERTSFEDFRDDLAGLGVDSEEIFANQFGAALLMPPKLVWHWLKNEHDDLPGLARRFGTSTQAMNLRLRNLRIA